MGILFFARKGSNTQNIKYKSEDYADELKDKFNDFWTPVIIKNWHDAETLLLMENEK
jgi:hypothetical protein